MSDDALLQRVQALELDNARLRRLLDRRGSASGIRRQVRNTLAMLREVVRQSAETSGLDQEASAHLEARLDAVFRIQNVIANGTAEGIGLHVMITGELLPHSANTGDKVVVDGPDVFLQPAVASVVALAIHELTTNAVKFGALSKPEGRLAVTWGVSPDADDGAVLTLRWVEEGLSNLPPAPERRGFGSDVIERTLRYQVSGDGLLDFAPTGLRCTIRLPLTPWPGGVREGREAPSDRRRAGD